MKLSPGIVIVSLAAAGGVLWALTRKAHAAPAAPPLDPPMTDLQAGVILAKEAGKYAWKGAKAMGRGVAKTAKVINPVKGFNDGKHAMFDKFNAKVAAFKASTTPIPRPKTKNKMALNLWRKAEAARLRMAASQRQPVFPPN